MTKPSADALSNLANVGPATRADLKLLGIETVADLAAADPDELYRRLSALTGKRHDPCVWDTFAAIIHEAKTGEKTKWWAWSQKRKNAAARSQHDPEPS